MPYIIAILDTSNDRVDNMPYAWKLRPDIDIERFVRFINTYNALSADRLELIELTPVEKIQKSSTYGKQ
jgi:hypothetical protein